jgi:hypothetical protein
MRGTVAAGVFFTLVVAGAFYVVQISTRGTGTLPSMTATVETETRLVPDGWKEYRSTAYHFSLLYPQELAVKEYAEPGNAFTVTFQNVKEEKGFQIFIVPYQEEKISDARFKKDTPSGVRTDVASTTIDQVPAVTFKSRDEFLGDTQETWFIYKGFLYEVTTFVGTTNWLDLIISTWKLI